ncbi:MAG TPA: 30S ribosomal protein S17 [Gammaproteobacteria bacterium]|nr:30S ribosomal protein S17 [Gammaproteobacteria bacterium]
MTEVKSTARTAEGKVLTSTMDKSIVVQVNRRLKHERLHKYITLSSKIMAHDENNQAKVGDKVLISEHRPYSKRKSWLLVKVISTSEEGSQEVSV